MPWFSTRLLQSLDKVALKFSRRRWSEIMRKRLFCPTSGTTGASRSLCLNWDMLSQRPSSPEFDAQTDVEVVAGMRIPGALPTGQLLASSLRRSVLCLRETSHWSTYQCPILRAWGAATDQVGTPLQPSGRQSLAKPCSWRTDRRNPKHQAVYGPEGSLA